MYVCDRCQKGLQVGMNVSHSHIRTKKRSLPNLHVVTVKIDGKNINMRLCTKCTRIVRKLYPYNQEPVSKEDKKEKPVKEVAEDKAAKEATKEETPVPSA